MSLQKFKIFFENLLKKNNCCLCKQNMKLIKAHIYPKWVYKALYPDSIVDNKYPLLVTNTLNFYTKRRPIGITDSLILCSVCDNYIGHNFDKPAKEYLLNLKPILFKDKLDNNARVLILESADPIILKNFILSLLLRAAWSKIEEYKHINLKENFLYKLEDIIQKNLETKHFEFGVFITKFKQSQLSGIAEKFSQVPYIQKINSFIYWIINLPNGYKIYVKADDKFDNSALSAFYLRKNYPIYIMELENFENSNEIKMLIPHLNVMREYLKK